MSESIQDRYQKLVQYRKDLYEDFPPYPEPKPKKVKTQTAVQEVIKQEQKVFDKVFSNVQLQNRKLTDEESLMQKQRRRLKVKHSKITLHQMGFSSITKGNNLYNLVIQEKVKILQFQAYSMNSCKMIVQTNVAMQFALQAGTLMYPDDQKAYKNQTLVLRDDLKAFLKQGTNEIKFSTFCFNSQLSAPSNQRYLLGNIRSVKYQRGMNQAKVWEITVKQVQVLQGIQKMYEREDHIAFTKTQILKMMGKWAN